MAITLTMGWWLAPAIITLICIIISIIVWFMDMSGPGGSYIDTRGFTGCIVTIIMLIPILGSWLIWALFHI